MTTKIKGWVDPLRWEDGLEDFRSITLYESKSRGDVTGVLVLTNEPVYTQSEVKDLLHNMMQLIDGDPERTLAAIEAVNAKHDLGLNPTGK